MNDTFDICRLCSRASNEGEEFLKVVVPLVTPPRAYALCANCADAVVEAWEVAVRNLPEVEDENGDENGDEGEEVEAV